MTDDKYIGTLDAAVREPWQKKKDTTMSDTQYRPSGAEVIGAAMAGRPLPPYPYTKRTTNRPRRSEGLSALISVSSAVVFMVATSVLVVIR